MSRTKSSAIPHYEMLYIISNKFSEDEVKPIAEKIKKIISDQGGAVTYEEDWGKKKMAYAIKGFNYGYYHLLEFDLVAEKVKEIDRTLRMMEEIIRHQIIARKIRTEEEIKLEKETAQKKRRESRETKEVKKSEVVRESKVDLAGLDEKLDKILETDDLL